MKPFVITKSGTQTNPNIVDGKGVQVKGSADQGIWINADWVILRGFEITGDLAAGIQNGGEGNHIEGCWVHDCCNRKPSSNPGYYASAIQCYNLAATYSVVQNCIVERIGLSAPNVPNGPHGIYVGHPFGVVIDNFVNDINAWCIHLYHAAAHELVQYNDCNNGHRWGDNRAVCLVGAGEVPGVAHPTHDYSSIEYNDFHGYAVDFYADAPTGGVIGTHNVVGHNDTNIHKPIFIPAIGANSVSITPNHIILVMLENLGYDAALAKLPYLKQLASQYTLFTNYYADTHPSIGNYFLLTTGRLVTNDDGFQGIVPDPTIVTVLNQFGKKCAGYAEGLNNGQNYLKRHDPFAYFQTKPAVHADYNQLASDLAAGKLADFVYITPNSVNDGHSGDWNACNKWLENNIPQLLNIPNTLVYVMFDEAEDSDTAHGGGHVVCIECGTLATRGSDSTFMQNRDLYARFVRLLTTGAQPSPSPTPVQPTPVPSQPQPSPTSANGFQTSVTCVAKQTITGTMTDYSLFDRWEVWDDTKGKKLYQDHNRILQISLTVPPEAKSIVVQAVSAKDVVLGKSSYDIVQ